MRLSKLAVFAAFTLGTTACQTATTETETAQAATSSMCTPFPYPTFGSVPQWGGETKLAGANELWILGRPEAQSNNESLAALVDTKLKDVTYLVRVHPGKRNGFIAMTQQNYGRIIIGGNPPPPPPIIDWIKMRPFLIAEGVRYDDVPFQSIADVQMVCGL